MKQLLVLSMQSVILTGCIYEFCQELTESDQLYLRLTSERAESVHSGVQVYQVDQPVSHTDAVGQPLAHRWAKQCTSGEAVFTDDILPSEGL